MARSLVPRVSCRRDDNATSPTTYAPLGQAHFSRTDDVYQTTDVRRRTRALPLRDSVDEEFDLTLLASAVVVPGAFPSPTSTWLTQDRTDSTP